MKFIKLFETLIQYESYAQQLDETNTPNVSYCKSENTIRITPYIQPPHDYSLDYFTVEAIDNCEILFECPSGGIQYSTDGGETWSEELGEATVNISSGDKVLLKGNMTLGGSDSGYGSSNPYGSSSGGYGSSGNFITSNGKYNVEGNIFSLYYGDNFTDVTDISSYDNCLSGFFYGDTYLINAEHLSLSATILSNRCYYSMFKRCSNLITAPSLLPATTLAEDCYTYMFEDCISLTTAPVLPAMMLADNCYCGMFNGCLNLTTSPELPATTLATYCYCGMFSGCINLTTAPELPATTLAEYCYFGMFSGCGNLNSITCLATNISANYCTSDWVSGVAGSGTFTKAVSMTNWTTGTSGIPSGWTVQDAA